MTARYLIQALRRLPLTAAFALCALTFLGLAAPECAAATYYVSNSSGNDGNSGSQAAPFLTIQEGVTSSASGDTVIVEAGTYTGSKNVDIDLQGRNVTLTTDTGDPTKTIIDCAGSSSAIHRGFYLHSGEGKNAPLVINGFTVKNGYSDGGNSRGGGGVYVASADIVTIQNCSFTGCTCTGYGGAIDNEGMVTLTNCTFNSDAANGGGGAIYDNGALTVSNVTFAGNTSGDGGGGIYNNGTNVITLMGCAFTSNAAYYGGGLYNHSGTVTITNCTIDGDSDNGYGGGGLYSDGGAMTMTGSVLKNNEAKGGSGGAIRSNYTNLNLTNCVVSGNACDNGNGGALEIEGYSSFTPAVTNCLVIGNTASGNGGGIRNSGPTLTLSGVTLSGNAASGTGGGLYVDNGTAKLTDDILYNDNGGEAVDGTSGQTAITASYCDILGGYAGTGIFDKNPKFVNPSSGDYHLQSGSPCLGAGTPITGVTTDLDGKTRANPPSLGCYEGAEGGGTNPTVTHLLWSNTDGKAAFWDVAADGSIGGVTGYGPYTDGAAQNVWQATALATGPDGVSHLLWNNTDGRVALWNVTDAGSVTGVTGFGPYTDGGPENTWRGAGVSVGPDNVLHLLWANTDHRAAFWNVRADGSYSILAGYGPFTDGASQNVWDAVAVSTGPDNVSHLLWANVDGRAAFWDVSDTDGSKGSVSGYGPYTESSPSNPNSLWGAVGLSVGPDNVSHLLWDNVDGRAAFWDVSSIDGSLASVMGYGPLTDQTPSETWAATALTTGPDGVSRLLWNNVDGRVALWSLDGSGNPSAIFGYGPYTDGAAQNTWSAAAVSAGP